MVKLLMLGETKLYWRGQWENGRAETYAAGLKQIVQLTFGGNSTTPNSNYKCTFENKYTFNELILTFRNTTNLLIN